MSCVKKYWVSQHCWCRYFFTVILPEPIIIEITLWWMVPFHILLWHLALLISCYEDISFFYYESAFLIIAFICFYFLINPCCRFWRILYLICILMFYCYTCVCQGCHYLLSNILYCQSRPAIFISLEILFILFLLLYKCVYRDITLYSPAAVVLSNFVYCY